MQTEIQIKVDESILLSLKENKENFVKDMLFTYALHLYRKNKLSLGKAAELAGYDRLDFIRVLQLKKEPIFDYDDELICDMIAGAERTTKHLNEQ